MFAWFAPRLDPGFILARPAAPGRTRAHFLPIVAKMPI